MRTLDKQLLEQLSEELARLCSDILELETPLLTAWRAAGTVHRHHGVISPANAVR
jgi:hypothetical protein